MRLRLAFTIGSLALLLAASHAALADTIVLKNGNRIRAAHVVEKDGRVTYETPAGETSLPSSIVARIERDDLTYEPAASAAPMASISAPRVAPMPGYDEIQRLTIHDDAIDFAYIAQLESDARAGAAGATEKAVAAHYAAAQFLIGKGDLDSARDHFREALVIAPDNLGLLLNLADLDLRENKFTAALDPLDRARRIAPDSPDAAKLTGWAYYGANKLDPAIKEWERAEQLRPDPEVEAALEKAKRDKAEEQDYCEGETDHFDLKYYGGAAPELAAGILRSLEGSFRDLSDELDYTPPDHIGVVLYTDQAFVDITRAPSWAGALYDGRIRVPVQGLTEVTPDLARVLRHELTHCFINQKTHGRAPTWLQEGLAQWAEGRRSAPFAGALLGSFGQGASAIDPPKFADLEPSWMSMDSGAAGLAYMWSLAAVESIIASDGLAGITRLLDAMGSAASAEDALRSSLHMDYSALRDQTLQFLRRESVQ